jgi:CBS domain-containing protein/anti-sigma regulatory factor (Ser/Thr protein kinase)
MTSQEITRVQELIYTTRVESVMASDVIVLKPDMSMSEVKSILRMKKVAGAPVMEGDRILGVISLSDVMDAMERGRMETLAADNMTKEVKTVLKDAPVTEAIQNLGRQGFGRLPVVDRDGKLVGIVTTGTIIKALLHEMDVSFQKKEAEKIQTYRASHIFEDISSDDTSLVLRYVVDDKDFSNAGQASSLIKRSLQRLGVLPSIIRRVAVAVYEAEMNLVIHTDVGGEITVEIRQDRLRISAVDHGPGIEDLEKVLQPGYSTAPEWIRDMGFGAGMGLANIKRCSDIMSLRSELGGSTRLDIVFLFGQNSLGLGAASVKRS